MSELEKIDVKETIIRVAQETFAKFGFRKTSMNEIAEAARKAKSSMYHYFKSKEEIFKIIIEREFETAKQEIKTEVSKMNLPQDKLKTYVIIRMRIFHRLTNLYSAIEDVYLENYRFIEKMRETLDKEEEERIKEILDEGVEKGIFSILDADSLASVFLIALKGIELHWAKTKNFLESEKKIDDLIGYLLYGILKR